MGKCFISYRHVKPDEDIARYLKNFLQEHNHNAFIDSQIMMGEKWVKKIEKQIKSSGFFVVLLSKKSILSDMVRQELELACELSRERGDRFKILPIRVDFTGKLPYDMGTYLNSIQYGCWEQGEDFKTIAAKLLAAIEGHEPLPLQEEPEDDEISATKMQILYDATDAIGAPLPTADPRLPVDIELDTGTVKLESPFYIKRKADEEMMKQIRIKGSTTIVKGSRQVGKSSLLARSQAAARSNRQKSCYIDFQSIEDSKLESLDILFKELAWRLSEDIDVSEKPDGCWQKDCGAKRNLTVFVEKALSDNTRTRLLILFDEVDRLFRCPFRDDFFSIVRYWHNLRAYKGKCWNRLNLMLAHSTEPYL